MENNKSAKFLCLINEIYDISGFLNVYKRKSNTYKGFKWVYKYKENGEDKFISNIHLFVLKYIVTSKNLPWKVIDESQAKKSIELEESKYSLYDNGFGILFLDIINDSKNPLNGFWRYKFQEFEFFEINLENLKQKVEKYNLPWIILNKYNAFKSFNLDLSQNFKSGIYRVNKIKHNEYNYLFQWVYIKDDNNFLVCDDLIELKEKVLNNNLNWIIINNDSYQKSIKENELNLNGIAHEKWAYTGIYRVRKQKQVGVLQGFAWVYRFKHKGNVVELSSVDLNKLKQKVIKNNYEWLILDESAACNSFKINNENFEKFGFNVNKNKTGIYRVFKTKENTSKQGFYWTFSQKIDGKRFSFTSYNLLKLKQKVINNGFEWIVVDKKLEKESFKENERNMKKYYN